MKHLYSCRINEANLSQVCEVLLKTGNAVGVDTGNSTKIPVSKDGKFLEISPDLGYINLLNTNDVWDIDDVNEANGKFANKCEKLKIGQSFVEIDGTMIIRIAG